jgi:hypothetical protein
MKILITGTETFTPITGLPEVGRYYNLEDAATGTGAQNRAFHALCQEYWKSGCHPKYEGGFSEFRDLVKRDLGAGFSEYVYATIKDGKPRIYRVKTFSEIPEEIREDPDMRKMIRGKLKSWGEYTKKERQETMDRLIDDMVSNGVQSKKFFEILEGMEE